MTFARVEVLEQRLGELPRRAQLVAQLGDRDRALSPAGTRPRAADGRQRLGVVVQRAPDPDGPARGAQRGQLGCGLAQLGLGRRLGARGAQALLQRQRGGRERRQAGARALARGPARRRAACGGLAPREPLQAGRAPRVKGRACGRARRARRRPRACPAERSAARPAGRRRPRRVGARAAAGRSARRARPRAPAPRACRGAPAPAPCRRLPQVQRGVHDVGRAQLAAPVASTSPRATSCALHPRQVDRHALAGPARSARDDRGPAPRARAPAARAGAGRRRRPLPPSRTTASP